MVTHVTRESSPVQFRPSVLDQLVVDLPREHEVRHAGVVDGPYRPAAKLVDGRRWNPKPAPAAPVCLLADSPGQPSTSRSINASSPSFICFLIVRKSCNLADKLVSTEAPSQVASVSLMMGRRENLDIVREYSPRPVPSYSLLRAYSQRCRETGSLLNKSPPALDIPDPLSCVFDARKRGPLVARGQPRRGLTGLARRRLR